MDDNKDALMAVPYIALESAQARHERTIKRFIIALIAVAIMLFASNIFWVYEWTQYDYVTGEEISLDAGDGGNANYIGNDGDITNYGKDYGGMYPYSWDDDGSYRGRSYAQRRDSMGRYSSRYSNRYSNRYSRHGDMISELHDLMQDAPDEHTRMEFQKFISKMEQTM